MKEKTNQNDQYDVLINELIEPQIDQFLETDEFYNSKSTPLKSAEAFKQEDRERIHELLSMKRLREDLREAQNLIRTHLSNMISTQEFDQVKKELDQSDEHFIQFTQTMKDQGQDQANDKIMLLKDMFGISNHSLLRIYELTQQFVSKEKYEEAQKVLTFLTTMDPQVPGFWLAQGLCLQALNKNPEAIEMYNIVKMLDSEDAVPFIYSAEMYIKLGDKVHAKHELDQAKILIKNDNNLSNTINKLNSLL